MNLLNSIGYLLVFNDWRPYDALIVEFFLRLILQRNISRFFPWESFNTVVKQPDCLLQIELTIEKKNGIKMKVLF